MNWDQIAGNWKEWRHKIKEQWIELTDDDLGTIRGQRDRMVNLLQERCGLSKGPAERALNEFLNGLEARSLTDGRLQPL
jgi:uncharacterized protein YjbJ (UPF0337 family)